METEKVKTVVETAEMRFQDAVPLRKLRGLDIGIAGLGAVGRQVAILLAAMGHKKVFGADPDLIELKNVGSQGWAEKDIGEYKAHILHRTLNTRRSGFTGEVARFEEVEWLPSLDVVFCCVDKMAARGAIWEKIIEIEKKKGRSKGKRGLWMDVRMAVRVMRLFTVPLDDRVEAKAARKHYNNTLYTDEEAFQGSCTDRMTMYGAYVAAGLMVSQLVNWLNGIPLVTSLLFETQRMLMVNMENEVFK